MEASRGRGIAAVVAIGLAQAMGAGGCAYPHPVEIDASLSVDASIDMPADAGIDAAVPTIGVTVALAPFVELGTTVPWSAQLVGPPDRSIRYVAAVAPTTAGTASPATASSALDASGALLVTGTFVASVAGVASLTVSIADGGEGSGSTMAELATFKSLGARAAFTTATTTTLNANRMFAVPVAVPAGTRIIAFGLRAGSAADVKIGLYGSTGSAPGDLLASSPVIHAIAGESIVYLTSAQTVAGTGAYLAVVPASDLVLALDASGNVNEFARNVTNFSDPLPSPFGIAATFAGGTINVFVIAVSP